MVGKRRPARRGRGSPRRFVGGRCGGNGLGVGLMMRAERRLGRMEAVTVPERLCGRRDGSF